MEIVHPFWRPLSLDLRCTIPLTIPHVQILCVSILLTYKIYYSLCLVDGVNDERTLLIQARCVFSFGAGLLAINYHALHLLNPLVLWTLPFIH